MDDVPSNYVFLSFVTYALWGPFENETDRLTMFSLDDVHKTTIVSRA